MNTRPLHRVTFGEAFGSLLDFSMGPSLASKLPDMPTHQFGVGRHWQTVGNRMRTAMKAVEHEQAVKQKAANSPK